MAFGMSPFPLRFGSRGGGGGLPAPPEGYAYWVDTQGRYFVDVNGAYILLRKTDNG